MDRLFAGKEEKFEKLPAPDTLLVLLVDQSLNQVFFPHCIFIGQQDG